LPEIPDGHRSERVSPTSQPFIWVEVSSKKFNQKILNTELAVKTVVFDKLRKRKY
jgi:hypothetical protein